MVAQTNSAPGASYQLMTKGPKDCQTPNHTLAHQCSPRNRVNSAPGASYQLKTSGPKDCQTLNLKFSIESYNLTCFRWVVVGRRRAVPSRPPSLLVAAENKDIIKFHVNISTWQYLDTICLDTAYLCQIKQEIFFLNKLNMYYIHVPI